MTTPQCSDQPYRISDVAKQAGVSVEALRYYERLGLLPRAPRTGAGARRYGVDAVARVRFIKQAQTLGLALREIHELIGVERRRSQASCRTVHALLSRHVEEIDRRVQMLRVLRSTLTQYRAECEQALAQDADPRCPTIDALEGLAS